MANGFRDEEYFLSETNPCVAFRNVCWILVLQIKLFDFTSNRLFYASTVTICNIYTINSIGTPKDKFYIKYNQLPSFSAFGTQIDNTLIRICRGFSPASNSTQAKELTMYRKFMAWMERTMTAAVFAEAGCFDTARQIMAEDKQRPHDRPTARPKATPDNRPVLRM